MRYWGNLRLTLVLKDDKIFEVELNNYAAKPTSAIIERCLDY